jgi:hypothetical protein
MKYINATKVIDEILCDFFIICFLSFGSYEIDIMKEENQNA